jgi:serine/threonine protein kinase
MKSLGRYEILIEIGRGAMGIVYLGSDAKIHRQVALKCLRPELFEASEETRKRFQGEILALGRLVHPNIVTIFDAGEDAATGTAYIVMEYVEGTSLGQLLKKGTPLSVDQIVRIGIDICRALDFAHSKGVIHRDIKPGNILLTSEQQTVKVTDFGIARLDGGSHTQTDHLLGTPQYMSPEQCKGERVDGRSDLFSVGALLYELLTRQKPFPGENVAAIMHQVLTKTPTPPALLSSDVPQPLSDIVMKALEKEPGRRFSTGAEMAEALAALTIRQEQVPEERPTVALSGSQEVLPPAPADRGRRWVWIPVAFGIVALIAWWRFAPQQQEPTPPISAGSRAVATPRMGQVDLTSTPIGAEVLINGEAKGLTPLMLDLPAGSHELVLKKEGHHPLEATITVVSGEKVPVDLKLTEEETP